MQQAARQHPRVGVGRSMEPPAVLRMLRLDETIAVLHQMLAAFVDLATMQAVDPGSRAPLQVEKHVFGSLSNATTGQKSWKPDPPRVLLSKAPTSVDHYSSPQKPSKV